MKAFPKAFVPDMVKSKFLGQIVYEIYDCLTLGRTYHDDHNDHNTSHHKRAKRRCRDACCRANTAVQTLFFSLLPKFSSFTVLSPEAIQQGDSLLLLCTSVSSLLASLSSLTRANLGRLHLEPSSRSRYSDARNILSDICFVSILNSDKCELICHHPPLLIWPMFLLFGQISVRCCRAMTRLSLVSSDDALTLLNYMPDATLQWTNQMSETGNLSRVVMQWHGLELNPKPSSYKVELVPLSHGARDASRKHYRTECSVPNMS